MKKKLKKKKRAPRKKSCFVSFFVVSVCFIVQPQQKEKEQKRKHKEKCQKKRKVIKKINQTKMDYLPINLIKIELRVNLLD